MSSDKTKLRFLNQNRFHKHICMFSITISLQYNNLIWIYRTSSQNLYSLVGLGLHVSSNEINYEIFWYIQRYLYVNFRGRPHNNVLKPVKIYWSPQMYLTPPAVEIIKISSESISMRGALLLYTFSQNLLAFRTQNIFARQICVNREK